MRFVKIFYFLGVCFFISCNNQMGNLPVSTQPSSLPSLTPLPQQVFKISSVKQTSTSNVMGLLFNPSLPSGPIANLCHLTYGGDTAQPTSSCQCVFRWKEKNDYNGSTIIIAREIRTSIVDVQAYALFCNIPPMYNNEIFDGTSVTVGVENTTQNTLGYQVQELKFIKQAGTNIGSFQDLDGNTFDNVLRYSCYEQFKRGMTVINRTDTSKSNPKTGEPVTFKIASQFCAVKADGSGGESEGCQGLPPSDNSAEAYYYSLFIPESKRGDINLENKRYKCPRVKESLRNSQVTDYWPLDTSFALSVKRSQDFNVGVEGVSNLSIGRGQTSIPSSCSDPVVKPSSIPGIGGGAATEVIPDSGLVKKCLGFARKPNGNGTCPLMKGLSGQTISTFRLRRFVAIYPPNFDTDGKMTNDAQGIDTIYVLDRAVVKPNAQNDVSGQVYFSMLGPKPCPFSFYDRKGLTRPPNENVEFYGNSKPGYASTNHPLWDKKNVDGIEFPNTDSNSSCAAALPLFNPQTGVWSVGTVHKTNPSMQHVYVRPIQPWIPHYEEDTEFLACAPEASLIVDPPMHFAKHAENFSAPWNVGWCAEVYPTQNPNVLDLDPLPKVGGFHLSRLML